MRMYRRRSFSFADFTADLIGTVLEFVFELIV
jgi:hypothetical protein